MCRYNETFDGVVLAYDPNIRSNFARILPGVHPYFRVKLKARLLLFNPKPGMLLGSFLALFPRKKYLLFFFCFTRAATE